MHKPFAGSFCAQRLTPIAGFRYPSPFIFNLPPNLPFFRGGTPVIFFWSPVSFGGTIFIGGGNDRIRSNVSSVVVHTPLPYSYCEFVK